MNYQIPKQYIPKITSDLVDSSYKTTIESGGGGSSHTELVAITTQTQLTDIANANKVLSIQGDIVLNSNITIPSGAIIEDGGGSVDVNGYKVLFQDNDFRNIPKNKTIFDFSYYNVQTQGFTSVAGGESEYFLSPIADNNFTVSTSVNGVFKKATFTPYSQKVTFQEAINNVATPFNLTTGDVVVVYYTPVDDYSRIDANSTFKVSHIWAKWFGLTDTADSALFDNRNVFKNILKIGKDRVININAGHYYITTIRNARFEDDRPNLTITGNTHLIGEGKANTLIEDLSDETITNADGSTMFVVRDASNGSFENIWLKGDLLTTANTQLEKHMCLTVENNSRAFKILNNRFSHATGDGIYFYAWDDMNQTILTFESGTIDTGTGVNATTTRSEQRSALVSISSAAISNGYGTLTTGAYANYSTLSDYSYIMYWYDVSNDFIGATDYVYTYKDVVIPTNATQFRTVIANPKSGVAPTTLQFRGSSHSKGVIVEGNEIDHNYRNGMSNIPTEGIVRNNYFHDNGGRSGGPSYGIDLEDSYMMLNDITIDSNTFENNYAGAITLRWCRDVRITNNNFLGNNTLIGSKSNVNGRETWDSIFENNHHINTDITVGRFGKVRNNVLHNSGITLANAYTEASGNVIYNDGIDSDGDGAYGTGISRNNVFMITRYKSSRILGSDIKSINDVVHYRNDITTGAGEFNDDFTFTSTAIKDYYKGLKVVDATAVSTSTGISLTPKDLYDCEFSALVYLRGGSAENMLWENNKFTDKIVQYSSNNPYPSTGLTFYEWVIDGGSIISNSTVTHTGTRGGVLNTDDIQINLTIKNFTFDLTDATTAYFFNFLHNGTTLIENCTFKTDAASTFNMNNAPTIDCPSITFKDCVWENVTPTYRTGDIVIETTKTTTPQ